MKSVGDKMLVKAASPSLIRSISKNIFSSDRPSRKRHAQPPANRANNTDPNTDRYSCRQWILIGPLAQTIPDQDSSRTGIWG
ncbi:hypothetical protein PR048_010814 [Dryococelus australis]|uniref:Uncharacterized protein n=1 Tax=Dryococelus australis TaxID=614101 RepID=A0ABQ9I3S4_9NEOP|nr:hypothetical protein PR048_010814 [Dryococelus australis]